MGTQFKSLLLIPAEFLPGYGLGRCVIDNQFCDPFRSLIAMIVHIYGEPAGR